MNKTFDKQTVGQVLGNVEHEGQVLQRTPLHVDFGPGFRNFRPSESVKDKRLRSGAAFNAIGSRCVGTEMHMPVIDADGGAAVRQYKDISKVAIRSAFSGYYSPNSDLRDVLGDYGIDMETFDYPDLGHGIYGVDGLRGMQTEFLVLRAAEPIFDVAPSTIRNHSHLYINRPFADADHTVLLDELQGVGVISDQWNRLAKQEGMGIVRTPWTERASNHVVS